MAKKKNKRKPATRQQAQKKKSTQNNNQNNVVRTKRRQQKVKSEGNKIYIKPNGKTSIQVKVSKHPILHKIIRSNWDKWCKDYQKATKNIKDGEVTIEDLPIYMIPEEQFKVLQKEVKTTNFQIVLHMNDSITTWVVLRRKIKYTIGQRIRMFFSNLIARIRGTAKKGTVHMQQNQDETK